MFANLILGLARGLLLGLIGGLCAGLVEAFWIIRDAPAMRSGLAEAALYAVVIDSLALAAAGALLGAVLTVGLRAHPGWLRPVTLVRIHVALGVFLALAFSGLLWAFRAAGATWETGMPVSVGTAVLGLAALAGALAYGSASPLSGLFANNGPVASLGIAAVLGLALVFPVQIALESGHRLGSGADRWEQLETVDIESFPADFLSELEGSLESGRRRGPQRRAARPNVLLITVDALRADHVGACGNDWISTPAIDLLVRYSALSCNTYTQQPQTNPALASLFTSTYPAVHGVRLHMVDRLADSFDTLAEILQQEGYRTAAVLPWTSLEPAFSGFHQGFQTYEAFVLNEPPALQNPAMAALAGIYRRVTDQLALGSAVEALLGLRQGTEAEIDGRADVSAAAASSWLSANHRGRFFLWVHYFDPHYPWTPPEPWAQLFDEGYAGEYDGGMRFVYEMREGIFAPEPHDVAYLRALYAAEISFADHYIGRMLAHMGDLGLLENTIIVLTADHGESLGERGTWWPFGESWLHGDDLYDSGIVVPLIVYDPASDLGPQLLLAPIQHIDVMPTILELLDLPIPPQAQGRSIVPLIAGAESGTERVAVTTLGDDSMTSIVSADGWKLIVRRGTAHQELYHLPSDPDEHYNVRALFPEPALALTRRLNAWTLANQRTATTAVDGRAGG